MAGITTYLENKLTAHSVGQASFALPANTWCGLFTVAPTAAYTLAAPNGSEVYVQNLYVRQQITWGAPSSGAIANSADIRFPSAGNANGPWTAVNGGVTAQAIVAIGVFDASSTGNLLWFGNTSASVTVNNGDDFRIAAGGLTISLS